MSPKSYSSRNSAYCGILVPKLNRFLTESSARDESRAGSNSFNALLASKPMRNFLGFYLVATLSDGCASTARFRASIGSITAAVSLYVTHYNLCRVHEALRTTPGVALGIAEVWTIGGAPAAITAASGSADIKAAY
jgi:hypothetical protein